MQQVLEGVLLFGTNSSSDRQIAALAMYGLVLPQHNALVAQLGRGFGKARSTEEGGALEALCIVSCDSRGYDSDEGG